MRTSCAHERLSAVDSLFLYLERPETPINIGCVALLDGKIAFRDFSRFVESKLPLIPRYRQRITAPPLNLAHPTWEFDPDFDLGNHVHHARLARGSEAELQEIAGRLFSTHMDRNKPLWDLTLVDGLPTGSAVVARVHHCLADGIAGLGLMQVLLDASPAIPRLPRPKRFKAPPLPDPSTSLLDALISSYSDLLGRVLSMQSAALSLALEAAAGGGLDELIRLVPDYLKPVRRLPFNQPCLAPRKVAWTRLPLADVKAIKNAGAATVNDFILTTVATALGRYSELHGASLAGRELRIFVPVNLRRPGDQEDALGNRISIMPVNVPLDIADPMRLLATVHERTIALKRARVAEFVYLAGTCLGMLPASLQAMSGALSPLVTFPVFNIVCTNVPGPQFPLYLFGRKVLTYYPHVPIGNDWGIGCAVQSYDGALFFGLTADSIAAPDINAVAGFIDSVFSEMQRAVRPVRRPRAAKRRQPVAAAARSAPSPAEPGTGPEPQIPAEPPVAPRPEPAAAAQQAAPATPPISAVPGHRP